MEECSQEAEASPRSIKTGSSSDSNSSSTGEEERLLRLFNSCDGDGDGFLDGLEHHIYINVKSCNEF